MPKNLIAPLIVVALLIGGGSFYGGMQYQKNKSPAGGQNALQRGVGANGQGRGFAGGGTIRPGGAGAGGIGGFTTGEVISKDATGLTLKLRDGGSKIILTSTSTRVGKMTDGSLEDVKQGNEVTITGTANQDGSISASTIQLRPAGMPGVGVGGRGQGGQGQPIAPQEQ